MTNMAFGLSRTVRSTPRCFKRWETFATLTGEEAAYETLIERFGHPIFSLVSWLMDDPSDAIQVVEEVFMKVFWNLGAFRDGSTLQTGIYRIAVNEALSRHWGQDGPPMPMQSIVDQLTHAPIEEALRTMNAKFRAALVLREIEGLSYEEIAEILDVSVGTVRSRISRGWNALRKHLDGRLDTDSALDRLLQLVD